METFKSSSAWQHPREQFLYRMLSILMTLLAVGDQTWWGYEPPILRKAVAFQRFLVYICPPGAWVSQVGYFYIHCHEMTFNARGIVFAVVPVTSLVYVFVVASKQKSYEKVMRDFMGKIHLSNLHQTSYVKKVMLKIERNTRYACYFMGLFLMTDWLTWSISIGASNYKNWDLVQNKTMRFESFLYHMLPFDYDYNVWNWLVVHIVNVYFAGCGCIIIIISLSINYAFVLQLIGHIEILKHRLKVDFVGLTDQDEIGEKLKNTIDYHSFVLNTFRDIQSAFAFNVTSYYLYNLIADSLVLYQMMAGDKSSIMVYFFMITAYIGGLIVMSFVLEEVRRQSDNISDLVYDLAWEKMSISNRKMLFLLLMRAQPALVFKAAGGLNAGVRPMLSILKSTFTYYVMLKSSMKT